MTEAISIGGLKLVTGHERYINDFKLAFCLIFFFQALINLVANALTTLSKSYVAQKENEKTFVCLSVLFFPSVDSIWLSETC